MMKKVMVGVAVATIIGAFMTWNFKLNAKVERYYPKYSKQCCFNIRHNIIKDTYSVTFDGYWGEAPHISGKTYSECLEYIQEYKLYTIKK